jgi:hydrogenase nickel incorporation protein HypA/HybF
MHELAVTESILELARKHAAQAGVGRVTRLRIVMGELSSFVDDSVKFYWDIISKGTVCEGSELVFERVPAGLLCLDCSREYTLCGELVPCPSCGSARVRVTAGDEFRLDSIDVDVVDPSSGSSEPPQPRKDGD